MVPPASPERWKAAEDLFFGALDVPPGDRLGWLAERCGHDAELSRLVQAMLAADATAAGKLDGAVAAAAAVSPASSSSPPSSSSSSQVGRRVGQYIVGREIGRSALATLFEGGRADVQTHRPVTIKILTRGAENEEAVRAFRAERHILTRLDHPGIVRLLDAGFTQDGRPYLITDFAEGIPINRYCREAPINVPGKLAILMAACEALQHMHERKVAMRSLKPANIVVSPEGRVKLSDFSGAVWLDPEIAPEPLSNAAAFPALVPSEYASPEVRSGAPATVQSDIYSLGAILLEAITGRKAGQARDAGPLSGLVSKALDPDPARRYASMREFATALRKHTGGKTDRPFNWKQAAVVGLALAGIVAAAWLGSASVWRADPSAGVIDSIAVLPFVNLGLGAGEDLVADGLTEDVIAALARVKELKVPGRSAVWQFKGRSIDPREAGRKLGVKAVMEGSVRKSGGQIHVAAHLVGVGDGFHLWESSLDRPSGGALQMQAEVAAVLVSDMRQRLFRQAGRGTPGPQAQSAFLEAYQHFNRDQIRKEWTRDSGSADPRETLDALERATRLDPHFAAAWAGLSEVSELAAALGPRNRRSFRDRAEAAATKALELEPSNALALATLGRVYSEHDWDLRKAEPYLRRAVEANPLSTGLHGGHANLLALLGRYDEAVELLERSQLLAPGDAGPSGRLAVLAATRGDWRGARHYASASLASDPRHRNSLWALARADELDGNFTSAEQRYRKIVALDPADGRALASLGYLLARTGHRDEAAGIVPKLYGMLARDRRPETFEALVRAGLGETDAALTLVEQAWRMRDGNILYPEMDSRFRKLAGEPRFQAVLQELRSLR